MISKKKNISLGNTNIGKTLGYNPNNTKKSKNKTKKIKPSKILVTFPKIFNINRIINNSIPSKENALNIHVDNIDMPNDFIYYQKNIIIIANLWNTNKLLTKRLTHSSKKYNDLINNKNELEKYNIVKDKKCCLENIDNPTIQDYYIKASLLDASKEDGKRRFIDDIFTEFNTINFLATMESRIRFLKLIIKTFTMVSK